LVLDKFRGRAKFLVDGVASRMGNVNPNSITALSIVFAFLFSFSFYFKILLPSFFLLLVASYLDALDGAVARLSGKTSKKGDFLDHLTDRYVDFIIIFTLTVSAFGNLYFGLFAVAGTFLSSYVGTQAQAVGVNRFYGGFPGRADRLVIVMVAVIIQIFTTRIFGFYITAWVLLFLGIAGFINSFYRSVLVYRSIP
jgi:phosphatidylglycerophosphate synthase